MLAKCPTGAAVSMPDRPSYAPLLSTDNSSDMLCPNVRTFMPFLSVDAIHCVSWSSASGVVFSIVHSDSPPPTTLYVFPDTAQAQWTGLYTRYCPGVAEIDIVVHEWGHALTQHTAGLIYAYQPGALNEAYSDIIGIGIGTNLFNKEELVLSERSSLDSCSSYDNLRKTFLEVHAEGFDGTQLEHHCFADCAGQ